MRDIPTIRVDTVTKFCCGPDVATNCFGIFTTVEIFFDVVAKNTSASRRTHMCQFVMRIIENANVFSQSEDLMMLSQGLLIFVPIPI